MSRLFAQSNAARTFSLVTWHLRQAPRKKLPVHWIRFDGSHIGQVASRGSTSRASGSGIADMISHGKTAHPPSSLPSRTMAACSYNVTAHSTAIPESVFELLADVTTWPQWAGSLTRHGSWEREGFPRPGGVGAVRKLGRWPVYGREEIVAYEPPTHLAYTIVKGQPVRNYRADVTLTPELDGTLITWAGTFDPLIPATGNLLTGFFRRIITVFAKGLAEYAATK